MDNKLSILEDKIDGVNNRVNLVDAKCNMILEDGDESNSTIKVVAADTKKRFNEKNMILEEENKKRMNEPKECSNYSEIALVSGVNGEDRMNKYTWIGDTGKSSHIINSLGGMFDLSVSEGYVKVGYGQYISIKK